MSILQRHLETLVRDWLGNMPAVVLLGSAAIELMRRASFFRTADGAEIDLLFERGGKPEVAVEIKRSSAPSPARGFAVACDDLGIAERYVVYPGTERFPLRHGAQAIGLAELMTRLRN
jgi:uncharacterized protein